MHLRKIISTFHKDHLKKPLVTSSLVDSALPIAKPSVKPIKPSAKQKQGYPTSSTKQVKEWDIKIWGFSISILVRLEDFFTNFVNFERNALLVLSSNFASFLSMNSTLSLRFLSINNTLPPIFQFYFLVSHWVRRFFIRLILRFSSSVFHWVKRFFIYHALSTKLKKLYSYTSIYLAELAS